MPEISLLSETEPRGLLALDRDILACVENAFEALATKPVEMPPILHLEIAEANGEIDVKTAYVPGLDELAMKMSPGFFDNRSDEQTSEHQSLMQNSYAIFSLKIKT